MLDGAVPSIKPEVILRVSRRRPELLGYLRPTLKELCQCYKCHIAWAEWRRDLMLESLVPNPNCFAGPGSSDEESHETVYHEESNEPAYDEESNEGRGRGNEEPKSKGEGRGRGREKPKSKVKDRGKGKGPKVTVFKAKSRGKGRGKSKVTVFKAKSEA